MKPWRIFPPHDLHRELNDVEQPGRYVGGEFGAVPKPDRSLYRVALCFPDLYEIGMSNTAIKLIYGMLNQLPHVACERVFAPAPDFEAALRTREIPLYTLETGTPLSECHLLAVSFSYELLASNLITVLAAGGIPAEAARRGPSDPLVLLGGPGATNPVPYARFIDGAYLGEAEAGFTQLVSTLADIHRRGGDRDDLLERLQSHRSVWYPGRSQRVHRAIWTEFSHPDASTVSCRPPGFGAGFPVPSIPVVQDHGVVEIMRGCPQGCRFCHAGMYYRPYRMKSVERVLQEVDWLVNGLGYRAISLSSLSSGDYGPLHRMMAALNERYQGRGVSLQLPSLRVDSFTLDILEQLNTVRRAGLTFAVESAGDVHQAWTNKIVPVEKVVSIAREARSRGWRRAKLYFMVGLPGPDSIGEADRILEYVSRLRAEVPLEYVVNVGTFVPKPHTPFQWEAQLSPDRAGEIFRYLKRALPRGTSLRFHDPWMSWLEGVLTRGDEKAGEVISTAHRAGARLDAWTDYLKIDIWRSAVHAVAGSERGTGSFALEERLPWDSVNIGISKGVLRKERERAYAGQLTERCLPGCRDRCGVCTRYTEVEHIEEPLPQLQTEQEKPGKNGRAKPERKQAAGLLSRGDSETTSPTPGRSYQLLLEYEKRGSAAFLPHLAILRVFERLWNRLDLPLELSSGHHPKPKMSFGQPLPTGTESDQELAIINLQKNIQLKKLSAKLFADGVLPDGIRVTRVLTLYHEHGQPRIPAPMQLYGGSLFAVDSAESEEDLRAFLEVCKSCGAEVFSDTPTIKLPADSWGLGRILKTSGMRGRVRLRRVKMWAASDRNDCEKREGESLFDWYTHVSMENLSLEAFRRLP